MNGNGQIKRMLEGVRAAEVEASLREERAAELEVRCCRLTTALNEVSGGGRTDRGDLLALWADARTKEMDAVRCAEQKREQLAAWLDQLENPVFRQILSLRYLSHLNWKQIRTRLEKSGCFYSERSIYYLHRKALAAAEELWEKEKTAAGPHLRQFDTALTRGNTA